MEQSYDSFKNSKKGFKKLYEEHKNEKKPNFKRQIIGVLQTD